LSTLVSNACEKILLAELRYRMQCGLATRKLSVRPSVCQTRDLFLHRMKDIIYPSFVTRRMVGWATPYTWNFGSNGLRWSKIADFQSMFARRASAV